MEPFLSKTGHKIKIDSYSINVSNYDDAYEAVQLLIKILKGKKDHLKQEDFVEVIRQVSHITINAITYEAMLRKEEKLRNRIEYYRRGQRIVSALELQEYFPQKQKEENKELQMAETKMTFTVLKKLKISLSEVLNLSGGLDENDQTFYELSNKPEDKSRKILNKYFSALDRKKRKIITSSKYKMLHEDGYYIIDLNKKYRQVNEKDTFQFLENVLGIIEENKKIRNRRSLISISE